eukprot:superscaffoldBa00002549_g14615
MSTFPMNRYPRQSQTTVLSLEENAARLDSGVKTEAGVGSTRLAELLRSSTHTRGLGFEQQHRSRRSVFLHSGVRICPQETINEVLASHQAYYQLRVCQEAVWEAFRIFFDRIPGTTEYQRWVHTCQHESLCISDLAKNFSSADEHMSMIHRRMNRMRDGRPPSRSVLTPPPKQKVPEIAGPEVQTTVAAPSADPMNVTSTTVLPSPVSASPTPTIDQTEPAVEDSELPNVVPESPVEQIVEFSIDLVDPGYRELLDDPDSPQYIDLAHHLQDQMQHVFDKLPGFKAIHVLGIRPGGISVHYSLVFEINSPKINSENSETATSTPQSAVDSKLKEMVTKALREEASLPIDLDSLNFEPESVLLPALTSTSSVEVVNESSEPDSHNEFEVFTDEPDVDKPRLVVPLTPLEKENALVTLLDPTAVPDDEMTAVTGGISESSDQPPAPEDISDESEEIYVSEPEQSNEEGEEEEVLFITHEIETIHHDETGELVRDYIPTPSVILEMETDAPYINMSPNLISEEDLTPIDEDSKNPSLDIIQLTPTTTTLAEEESSDLGLPVTTLSAITGQPPTEPTANIQEEVNALPDEEEVDLGVPNSHNPSEASETENQDVSELETDVELLEPEGELVAEPDEEVLEVLVPTPELTEVSEPEEENSEESESEIGMPEVSEPEEKVEEVSEPEESVVENQEELAVTEPEDMAVEVTGMEENELEISEPVGVLEIEEFEQGAEPDYSAVEVLEEEGVEEVEVLQPGEEIVEVTKEVEQVQEPEEDIVEVSDPATEPDAIDVSEQVPEPEEESEIGGDVDEVSEQEEQYLKILRKQYPKYLRKQYPKYLRKQYPKFLRKQYLRFPRKQYMKFPRKQYLMFPRKQCPKFLRKQYLRFRGNIPEVPEDAEAEVVEEEALDVATPAEKEEVAEVLAPEDEVVESEEEVVEIYEVEQIVEAPASDEGEVEPAAEPESELEEHVTEVTETGDEVVEAAESEEEQEGDSEPSEEMVEVVELAPETEPEPEPGKESDEVPLDAPEIPQPDEDVVEDVKPEEEVVEVQVPEEDLEDISQAQIPPEAEGEELVENPKPEEASEPEEGAIDVLTSAEDLPGVSELESDEGVVDEVTEPVLEEPPAESIKILHPLDDVDDLHFREDAVHVVEDVEFLQPIGPNYNQPHEVDNLPVIPIEIQPSEGDEGEPDHEYPIIDDFYIEEDVDSMDTQVESDTDAVTTSETATSDLHFETTSDKTEVTAPDKQDTSEGTEVKEDLLEETQESDSSPESVTAVPVSDFFPTPPATSLESEVSSPSPNIDSGLFEVVEQSVISSAPESSEDDSTEPEEDLEQIEPSIVIMDEDLEEAVEEVVESQTSPPATNEDVIDVTIKDLAVELDQIDVAVTEANELPDEASGFPTVVEEHPSNSVTVPPPVRYLTTPAMTTASHGRELVVFFSLRVTNMDFSEDLFNKTSSEYRSLESTFLNVNPCESDLQIQIVVNGYVLVFWMKRETDQADPCKFMACDEFSSCVVNGRTKEAQCLCEPGYQSVDGLPCQSVCVLQPDYCQGGECHIVRGHGAVCR